MDAGDSSASKELPTFNLSDSENEFEAGIRRSDVSPLPMSPYQSLSFPLFSLSPSSRLMFPVPNRRHSSTPTSPKPQEQIDTSGEQEVVVGVAESACSLIFASTSKQIWSPNPPLEETPFKTRLLKTSCTKAQQLQEQLYETKGTKPSNLAEENQLLYQTLDFERKRFIKRKALCAFTYGALLCQREQLAIANSHLMIKSEECAARVILHSLLLQAYRRAQDHLKTIMNENINFHKKVENLQLQLRVVRHLQTVEKERVVQKTHEIGNLKTELDYDRKILSKTKTELHKRQQDCESLEKSNTELAEAKYKILREQRLAEEKKDLLQSSLAIEKQEVEQQTAKVNQLQRQVIDLRTSVADLTNQSDEYHHQSKALETTNSKLQTLLLSREAEVVDLSQTRNSLVSETQALQKLNSSLRSKNDDLALEIVQHQKTIVTFKENLVEAESDLRRESEMADVLGTELGRVTQLNSTLNEELVLYQLANTRRRRYWANLTKDAKVTDRLGKFVSYFVGRPNDFIAFC